MNASRKQARRRQPGSVALKPGDALFLSIAGVLILAGMVVVSSASLSVADGRGLGSFHYVARHIVYLVAGAVMAFIGSRVPMRIWEQVSASAIFLAYVFLLLVFLPGVGKTVNGSTRWIDLGPVNFQVVEGVKLLMIIYLAGYLVRHGERLKKGVWEVIKPLLLTAIAVLLLLLQPDFGSAVLLIGITGSLIWLAGAKIRHLFMLALIVVPALAMLAYSQPYRIRRLTSFLDPWADPYDGGFQLSQALIAVGRGEWFGVGLGESVQKLFYLPEAHTDFIFAVYAEEFGFAGVSILILAFSALVYRVFLVAQKAANDGRMFAAYVCHGIALWIAFQVCISIGVNLGVLPTKGLTLPFFSVGGSSLVAILFAMGIVYRTSCEQCVQGGRS